MLMHTAELDRIAKLDHRLVEAAKGIKVLSSLTWPAAAYDQFLTGWHKKNPVPPSIIYPKVEYSEVKDELLRVMSSCSREHPIEDYIFKTAESYFSAATMIENVGSPIFTEISTQIYGQPEDPIGAGALTNHDAATYFVEYCSEFMKSCPISDLDYCITPQYVAAQMRKVAKKSFAEHKIKVVVDSEMSSKAAAGANRIRIRGATPFSRNDLPQLLEHELFVHTATLLNGRQQPRIKSLSLGAPRTTMTQEGLALFAEFITHTIDLARLQRIALRVLAIEQARQGANFVDIVRMFIDAGQSLQESYYSAMRVFRGGSTSGHLVFTKDVVYLRGLIFVHTFLRKAIQKGHLNFPRYLFSGRLTFSDIIELDAYFESNLIVPPIYQPEWVTDRSRLTAYLVYSSFIDRINLGSINLDDFVRWGL